VSSMLKRKGAQVLVGVALVTSALVGPSPASAVIRGLSFYTIVDGPSWTQAEANAVILGGHLVAINDAGENQWIKEQFESKLKKYVNGSPSEGLWIGINNANNPGVYEWTSGELVTYTDWNIDEPNNAEEPGGTYQRYGIIKWQGSDQSYIDWGDYWNTQQSWSSTLVPLGIAEISINFSASQSASPIEGSGLFTTSLFFSAGIGSNLVNGETIYWELDGISADDLASGSMTGFGVVTNGQLDITHSLLDDGLDDIENFIVTAYSDPILRTPD